MVVISKEFDPDEFVDKQKKSDPHQEPHQPKKEKKGDRPGER